LLRLQGSKETGIWSCMRVLMVTTGHFALDDRIYYKEAVSLHSAGHQVTVMARAGSDGEGERIVGGIRLVTLGSRGHLSRGGGVTRQLRMLARAVQMRPDVVHCHEPESLLVAYLVKQRLGCPLIYDIHDDYPEVIRTDWGGGLVGDLMAARSEAYEEAICGRVHHMIAAHEPLARHYQRFGVPVTPIQNFPITGLFHRTIDPGVRVRYRDMDIFVHVGQLKSSRGMEVLMAAFLRVVKDHPHAMLVVTSGSPPEALLGGLSTLERSRVDFLGWVDYEVVPKIISCAVAGLALMKRTPFFEMIVPNKVYEFMACGCPVIASGLSEVRRYVADPKAGVLLGRDLDASEVAEAMGSILEDRAGARTMGNRGARAVRSRYNWKTCERSLLGIYEGLEGRRRSP
jgi:glycosyltransferase involved in cell wall biosynthesis